MNGKQAAIRLKLKLNQLDSASNRTVRVEQALIFLDDAYLKLAKAKYIKSNNAEDKSGFQFNQVTTDELNHLTKSAPFPLVKEGKEYTLDMSEVPRYWIHLKSKLKVVVGNKSGLVNPNYRTLDTISTAEEDPFNETTPSKPLTYFEDNKIKVSSEGFEVPEMILSYYQFPEQITLTEEIKAPFVQEIIDTAALLILENWGDPRTQSHLTVNKVVENE